jgi:hypothetical protein
MSGVVGQSRYHTRICISDTFGDILDEVPQCDQARAYLTRDHSGNDRLHKPRELPGTNSEGIDIGYARPAIRESGMPDGRCEAIE